MSTLLYPSSGYFRWRGKAWLMGEGTGMSFMVLVLMVGAISFSAERPVFEGMGMSSVAAARADVFQKMVITI